MNSEMIETQLENCLSELRGICEHLEPPPSRWQKIKARVIEWWLCNEVSETLIGFLLWVGVPLLLSMCHSGSSAEPKSRHRDVVAEYTVTYYADGTQEWEEVGDDQ